MQDNPMQNSKFIVNLGEGSIGFQEVIIPDSEVGTIEYRDGSDVLPNVRKMPGLVKYSNLVLKRGIINSVLYDWFKQTKQGKTERRDITVSLLNEDKEPVVTWKMKNCWPTKYSGPTLNSTANEVVIETLEIAVENLDIEFN